MRDKKPNILFIQADQLAASHLGVYGHRVVKTPNLNRLAQGGVVFERAYCNFPLCAPSRFSMMSGRLASEIGAYDNGAEFPSAIPTFAHYLRLQGYRTAISGKMHFIGPDDLHGLEERVSPEIYTAHFRLTADWSAVGTPSQHVMDAGPCRRTAQLDYDEEVAFRTAGKLYDFARDTDDRPFFLIASFTHPHDPYLCTEQHWDRYRDDEIELPAVRLSDEERDPHSKRLVAAHGFDEIELTDDLLRAIRRAYYANVSYLDDKVGQLLTALTECDFADDTIVIFTADHGDMIGERGLFHKWTFFENSARVPLIVYAPRLFEGGRREERLVSLVDLFPTIVQMACGGAEPDLVEPVAGQSLYGCLAGDGGSSDNAVYGELLCEPTPEPVVMIRQGSHKYISSETDPPLLYDLQADPLETTNLAGSRAAAEVERGLRASALRRWDLARLREDVLASQVRRRLIFEAHRCGTMPDWDRFPLPPTGRSGYFRQSSYADWSFSGRLP